MADQELPQHRRTSSGISVDPLSGDFGLTSTVTLSRKGMGIGPRARDNSPLPTPPPPKAVMNMIYSVAREDGVSCPRCDAEFEITPQFYHAIAECPECSTTFVIKPPGTPPFRPPHQAESEAPQKAVGTVIPTGSVGQRRRAGEQQPPMPQAPNHSAPPPPPPPAMAPRSATPERRPEVLDLDLDEADIAGTASPAHHAPQGHAPAPPPPAGATPPPRPSGHRPPPRQMPPQDEPVQELAPPTVHHGRPAAPPPPPPGSRPPPPPRSRPSPPQPQAEAPRRTAARRPPTEPAASTPQPQDEPAADDMMSTIEFQRPEEGVADRLRQGIQQGQAAQPAVPQRPPQHAPSRPPASAPGTRSPQRPPQPVQQPAQAAQQPPQQAQPTDAEVDEARRAPASHDPRRRQQPPPPRRVQRQAAPPPQQQPQPQPYQQPQTTSSGISLNTGDANLGNDMMSTIEIQREEGSVVDRLRQGLREGQNAPEPVSPQSIDRTVELQRDEVRPARAPGAPATAGERQRPPRRTSSGIQSDQGIPNPNALGTIEMQREDRRTLHPATRGDNIRQRGAGIGQPAIPQPPAAHVAPPGAVEQPSGRPARNSGIDVQQGSMAPVGMTGTVTLSRKGMGMRQQAREGDGNDGSSPARPRPQRRPPPQQQQQQQQAPRQGAAPRPVQGPYAVVQNDHVSCPHCAEIYEIPPEVYGALAECPDCGSEFTIMPPGTPPAEDFAGRPAPAAQPAPAAPRDASTAPDKATAKAKTSRHAPMEAPGTANNNKILYAAIGILVVLVLLLALKLFKVI